MTDILSKEQLLILQLNLSYEQYEEFMNLFKKDEILPDDIKERKEKILEILKEHSYWGEIWGWGCTRVYKRIPKEGNTSSFSKILESHLNSFTGKSRSELNKFLDKLKELDIGCLDLNECLGVSK